MLISTLVFLQGVGTFGPFTFPDVSLRAGEILKKTNPPVKQFRIKEVYWLQDGTAQALVEDITV